MVDVTIIVVLKLSKLKTNCEKFHKQFFYQQALPFFFNFQELGTLLNSLKEGVKTVTAITKYVMVIGEEYALGD